MAMTRAGVSALFHAIFNAPEELYQDANKIHKQWYWIGMLSLVFIIMMYVMMSYMGMPWVIAVINAVLILVLGFYISNPAAVLILFGGGAAYKFLSYDWNWGNIFRDGKVVFPNIQMGEIAQQGWKTYVAALKLPAHFLIIAIATGATLTLLRIEHPMYALVFFPIAAAIGVWAFAHNSESKWYKRITLAILVIGALASFYQAFAGPSLNDLTYQKTFPVQVRDLHGQKVCGIRPGERKFSVPKAVYVTIGGQDTEVSGFVLLNQTVTGERFSVGREGCADLSFIFTAEWRKQPIEPQVIFITIW